MKCRNCQKENPESAKICVFCGKPLYDTPPAFHPPKDEEEVVLRKEEQPSPAPQPKRSKTPMIVAIVLGALIVLGLAFAVIFGLRYSQQMDQKDEQIQDLLEENDQAWESLQEEREARQDAEEKAQLNDKNTNGAICKDAVVPIVNVKNTAVENVTADILAKAYKGEVKTWAAFVEAIKYIALVILCVSSTLLILFLISLASGIFIHLDN